MKNKLIHAVTVLALFALSGALVNAATVNIPGYVNAEDYERYSDNTPGNQGQQYRADDVDIAGTNDDGGGYIVGWTEGNEWLEYDINIAQAGQYTAEVRVASSPGNGRFELKIDGETKAASDVASTGGWGNWDSLFVDLGYLPQGSHNFRFDIRNGGFNVNWVKFIQQQATTDASVNGNGAAPLEPDNGKVIFGIGQDGITLGSESTDTTKGQLRQMHDGIWHINQATGVYPMLRHFYAGEFDAGGFSFQGKLQKLTDYNQSYDHDYIAMFSFKFKQQQVWDLLNGELDDEIKAIGKAAAENGRPMFFRPFYEFNQYGDSEKVWLSMDGQGGKTKQQWFIDAWKKFRSLVREGVSQVNGDNDNIAFVWCLIASDSNVSDFDGFYPGDAEVDWVGIDIFSKAHLDNASGAIIDWIKANTDRGDGTSKPVILPEVQPALKDGAAGDFSTQGKQYSVDQFFSPLFDFIESNTEVKALIYMTFWFEKLYTDNPTDFAWVGEANLSDWRDGRVQPIVENDWDKTVFDFFTGKIGNSNIYLSDGQEGQLE